MKVRIGLVGGGTGGHFYPLIAVAESIYASQPGAELYYYGPHPYNPEILKTQNIRWRKIAAGKQRRYASIQNFLDTFRIIIGVFQGIIRLYFDYPDVIVSKGGYTSVPVIAAAAFLRIPIVIHESDAVPGRANKFAKKFARYIAISYDDAAAHFPAEKTALIGIPIRQAFFQQTTDPRAALGISTNKPIIFVTGGSLGAMRINTLVLDSLDELLPNYAIIHQAGADHATTVQETAKARGLAPDLMADYYVLGHAPAATMAAAQDAAALIISRAGSTSMFEIALKGKPSIIIPIPESVSHDQRTNAYAYARSGAASVIEEDNLTDGLLAAEVNRIMGDKRVYQAMATAAAQFTNRDAAAKLAATVLGIAAEH
jgi:UDP-N-acetylglucosamine--N-acetylmuramyl-(pentapeptide) pyrophosphoryl-undecaprenol N-acetylglucosamine transferase